MQSFGFALGSRTVFFNWGSYSNTSHIQVEAFPSSLFRPHTEPIQHVVPGILTGRLIHSIFLNRTFVLGKLSKDKTQLFYNGKINQELQESYGLSEQSQSHILPYGHANINLWDFDGIHIRHCITRYIDYYTFEKENSREVVTLGFNLRGNSVISQC